MCRFSAQYWIMATDRAASGSASGGSTTIFAGGCSPVMGIIETGQWSVTLCANAGVMHSTTARDSQEFIRFIIIVLLDERNAKAESPVIELSCRVFKFMLRT